MSTKICESTQSFSRNRSTIIFCWKLGWATFSKTLRTIIGKNTPISAFNPALNLDTRLMKMEQESWKTIISVEALFFNNDRHKYCLMAPKNLVHHDHIEKNRKFDIRHFISWERTHKLWTCVKARKEYEYVTCQQRQLKLWNALVKGIRISEKQTLKIYEPQKEPKCSSENNSA